MNETICSVESCIKPARVRGMCRTHYRTRPELPECSVDGCDRRSVALGLCQLHRRWQRERGTTEPLPKLSDVCMIEGCTDRRRYSNGLCHKHMRRIQRNGRPDRLGPKYRYVDGHGYVWVHIPARSHPLSEGLRIYEGNRVRIMEHRLVLFDSIGPGSHPCNWCDQIVDWGMPPKTLGSLVVDHLNWDRADNNPDNLVPSCERCNTLRKEPQ